MQSLHEGGLRPGVHPGRAPVPHVTAPLWRHRVMAVARGPWGRPLGRAGATLGAVVFLAWLGARSAVSTPPQGEPDPKLESIVTMAAMPVSSVVAYKTPASRRPDAGSDAAPPEAPAAGVLPDGRIVLNVAGVQDLCRLKGIGPARANKIVALRERLGRFRSIRQLLRVRGIGPRTLQRLRPSLVLDTPPVQTDAG